MIDECVHHFTRGVPVTIIYMEAWTAAGFRPRS